MGLAQRRYHTERIKKKVRDYYGKWAVMPDGELSQRVIGLLTNTRTPCSCPMCGNPRRHFGHKTRQEIRAEQDAMEA